MSNIIKDNNTLLYLKDVLKYLNKNEFNVNFLEDIMNNLIPKKDDNALINFKLVEKETAAFHSTSKCIYLSFNKINKWLTSNTSDFFNEFNEINSNILKNYLLIYLISHEIEHSYQYLFANNILPSNDIIRNAYKGLFDLFEKKDCIFPRPIKNARRLLSLNLYKKNENFYLLERNANIECCDLLIKLSLYDNNEYMNKLFSEMKNTYMKCGYINSNLGSIEETYLKIAMHDKFLKFDYDINISQEEKIRYGIKISEETRKKLLSKKL